MSEHYDLVVIGAGPAGEKGAAQAAYFGKHVCIVERAPRPGGAAINTGTIPSKTLRETALYFSGLRQHGLYGVDYHVKQDITISDFMLRERSVIAAEWKLIDDNIRKHEISQIQGAAAFIDAQTLEVSRYGESPRQLTSDFFLIATGSHPLPPKGVAVDGRVIVDSDTLLTLDKIPASMIVVGGGVIGSEYACIFAALGVRVTIVTERTRLLAHLDAEVGDALRQQMTGRLGVSVHLDAEIVNLSVENDRAVVTLGGGDQLSAECALYCAGRIGASAGIGLEAAGVRTNARGFIHVNEHYATDAPGIYAAGDVIGFPALASTSMEQARVAVCHAFDFQYKQALANVIPYGVYTIPEIGTVGMTEEQLHAKGIDFEIGRALFRANPRGQIIGDLDGFVKILFRSDDQTLLGASVVGENAAELIHIAMACLSFNGTIDFFIQSVFNYPSLADAFKYAAYDGLQALARRHGKRPGLPSSGPHRVVPTS
ncbi:MAG TPA: Si-specific NAD(P)(+) transhydrogenase [Gemmatimonadaceae bacterium]|nr:Si-specific NAD(P)(+) transhydrogenase [Gemmatimonadaceae bacterium]